MNDWVTAKLKDIGRMRGAGADKLIEPGEKPVRLVNYMDVYQNHRIANAMEFQQVTATDREIAQFNLKQKDVLFTPTSETPDDIANAAVVIEDLSGAVYSYHLTRFRPNQPDSFDTDFLGYLFNNPSIHRYFWAHACGQTRYTLNRADFNNLVVHYPKLKEEQTAIARALGRVDDAIAAVRESITKAERLLKGLTQHLLTGRQRPDGSLRQKNEFWTHQKVGPVPIGWKVSALKQLSVIQRGKFSYRPRNEPRFFGGPYPFIQTADIVASRGYIRSHSQTLSEEGRRISRMFPKGTIMITIAANIGDTAIAAYDVFATDSVIGITPREDVNSEFLELCMRVRKNFLECIATQSAQANINYGNLRPLLIALPAAEEDQKAVALPIITCEKLILDKEQKIGALQQLKKSMMQNLLTGGVRLPVDDAVKDAKS